MSQIPFSICIVLLLSFIIFLFKKYIISYIIQKAQFGFKKQLEEIKSDLKKVENKDSHIFMLLKDVILKDNQEIRSERIKAINKLWECFLIIKNNASIVSYMPQLDNTDLNIADRFTNFCCSVDIESLKQSSFDAKKCRIWISVSAWITFGIYEYIVLYALEYAEVLEKHMTIISAEKYGRSIDVINHMLPGVFNESELTELGFCNVTHENLQMLLIVLELKLCSDLFPNHLHEIEQSEKIESISSLVKRTKPIFDNIDCL